MVYKIMLYPEWGDHIKDLSLEDKGKILECIFEYDAYGTIPYDGYIATIFLFIKKQIDYNKNIYENRCKHNQEVGKLGGRPKKDWDNSQKPKITQGGLENNPKKPNTNTNTNTKDNNIIPPSEDFEKFWKEFPHARKGKKQEAKKYFNQQNTADVFIGVALLRWMVIIGEQDPQYIPACNLWIRDFTILSEDVRLQILKKAILHIRQLTGEDRATTVAKFKQDFGEEFTEKLWKDTPNPKDKIKLKLS